MEFSQCTAPGWVSQGIFQVFWDMLDSTQPTKHGVGAKTTRQEKIWHKEHPKTAQIQKISFWEFWVGLIPLPDPTPASTNTDLVQNPWKNEVQDVPFPLTVNQQRFGGGKQQQKFQEDFIPRK